MLAPGQPHRRLPAPVRRRLEVATATAWEALVETHAANAVQFIEFMADRLSFEDAVERYLHEMDVSAAMAAAVRNRVLVALEDTERDKPARPPVQLHQSGEPEEETGEMGGWRRFRPDVVMRGVKARHRRHEETEHWIKLAIAWAEENAIRTHIDNAVAFAALLEEYYPLDRCIAAYIDALGVTGSRGQAVFQRTMARIAEDRLPPDFRTPTARATGRQSNA